MSQKRVGIRKAKATVSVGNRVTPWNANISPDDPLLHRARVVVSLNVARLYLGRQCALAARRMVDPEANRCPKKYRKFAATPGGGLHLLPGWQSRKEACAMKIVETAELAPTCHAGCKLVETAEIAPTCHNLSLVETTEVAPTCH